MLLLLLLSLLLKTSHMSVRAVHAISDYYAMSVVGFSRFTHQRRQKTHLTSIAGLCML